jgi:hypothetical protein
VEAYEDVEEEAPPARPARPGATPSRPAASRPAAPPARSPAAPPARPAAPPARAATPPPAAPATPPAAGGARKLPSRELFLKGPPPRPGGKKPIPPQLEEVDDIEDTGPHAEAAEMVADEGAQEKLSFEEKYGTAGVMLVAVILAAAAWVVMTIIIKP